MYKSDFEIKKELCEIGRRIYNDGFVAANDGNFSVKIDDNTYYVTPTGVSKGFMTPEMICKVDGQGNLKEANGPWKPSSEFKMHLKVYQQRPDVNAVVHAHPPIATSFAIAGIPLDKLIMPEAIIFLGAVPIAQYGTPSTNPSCTVICNSICMLAGGNGVIFNPHPHAKRISAYAVDLVNRAILAAGGPENIVCTVKEPTRETSAKMVNDPSVRMLVATGGPGVVKMLLSSGKKAIGAGAGNPPVVVDDTADIPKAAKDIIDGCTFDNNLPCIAEKECFVMKNVADELIQNMLKNGAYLINAAQVKQLEDVVLVWSKPKKEGEQPKRVINKDWVGRDAKKILAQIGINVGDDIRCIICETEFSQAFVQTELMMPILPIVRVDTFDEAVEMAVKAEHGNRHSAHLHSKNVDHMTQYAKAICTTIFVKNAPSYAGIGFNAEGWTTFTIAGPTGEGITSPRSFTRQRRCVLSDALNII